MAQSKQTRVKCIAEGCSNFILPATARVNSGFCAPCVQKKAREEQEKFIRENRREVDPYAGLSDSVDIIRVLHTRRKYDPLIQYSPPPSKIEELYDCLNEKDANRLMDIAAHALLTDNIDFAEKIAQSLAVLTDYSLDRLLCLWIQKAELWPSMIFRGAGSAVRDAIIHALENGKTNPNHALSALAWIGDDEAQSRFRSWDSQLPAWTADLFIQPSEYSEIAGWELVDGARRDLYHSDCLAITPVAPAQSNASTLRVMKPIGDQCPWCRRQLVHMVEVDLSDQRFAFLNFGISPLPILTCQDCTCYTPVFAFLSSGGQARWAGCNERPDFLPCSEPSWIPSPSPWQEASVSLRPRRAIEAVDWCMQLTASQVGGLPCWVQSPAYPKCPSCTRTMIVVAQIDNAAFARHEGIYYGFLCADCRMTATTYQQS